MSHQCDCALRLTRLECRTIFSLMRRANSLSRLLQTLSFVAMGLLLSVGAAAAHDGHASNHVRVAQSSSPAATAEFYKGDAGIGDSGDISAAASMKQADAGKHDGGPCSEGRDDAKHIGGCCTMACHAALGALPMGPVIGLDKPDLYLAGFYEALDGRSGDRAERPPKLT